MRATGPGQSALLLIDAIDVLNAKEIGYAVVGAMAAAVHGVVRASLDAGALLSLAVQEASKLEATLRATGLETELRRGDPDDPIPALLAVTDAFGNRVDLLVGLRGLDAALFSRTSELPFQGTTLQVVGLEDFIAMKAFAGGPQDLSDAAAAIVAASQPLDLDLLRRLARGYGREAAAALEKLLARTDRPT